MSMNMDYSKILATWSDSELVRIYALSLRMPYVTRTRTASEQQHEMLNEIMTRHLDVPPVR